MSRSIWNGAYTPDPRGWPSRTAHCANRDELLEEAKAIARYAPTDTPCEPRRSAYTDDNLGSYHYTNAEERWDIWCAAMMTRQDLCWPEDLELIHKGEPRCEDCGRSDDHEHCDECDAVLPDHFGDCSVPLLTPLPIA